MKLKVFSVRDSAGEIFNTPFYARSHGEAERSFTELARDPQSRISKFPEHYDLWLLGSYDDQTGKFDTLDTPQHVRKAVECLTQ